MKVIDISEFNGAINFSNVKREVDGVIVRVGYRGYGSGLLVTDKRLLNNLTGCNANNIALGCYFVTQAINEAEAVAEANYVLQRIKGFKMPLGVFIDTENGNPNATGRADRGKLTKGTRTAVMNAFCKTIREAGYKTGVYASENWFTTQLNTNDLDGLKWVAKYSAHQPAIKFNIWQYSDKGRINGINGNVDMNNYESSSTPVKKTNEEIAEEVIAGNWGNGNDRKKKLTEAGYDYDVIQKIVNTKLKPAEEYYVIQKGDTLTAIARKYGTTINKLKALNNIKNANKIYAGQKIKIK